MTPIAHAHDAKTSITVWLDGHELFTWDATGVEIAKFLAKLPEWRKASGSTATPKQDALGTLLHIQAHGYQLFSEPDVRRDQMDFIAYLALLAEKDGMKIADLAGLENRVGVHFTIERDADGKPDEITALVDGWTKAAS